jgi:hypothetical protein
MEVETAAWLLPTRSPATVKLPVSTIARNVASVSRSKCCTRYSSGFGLKAALCDLPEINAIPRRKAPAGLSGVYKCDGEVICIQTCHGFVFLANGVHGGSGVHMFEGTIACCNSKRWRPKGSKLLSQNISSNRRPGTRLQNQNM